MSVSRAMRPDTQGPASRWRLRRTILGLLVAASLGSPVSAQDKDLEVSGFVSWTSDYVYRGISQNRQRPPLQAAIRWAWRDGWYADLWGSSVAGSSGKVELDVSAGWRKELRGRWAVDVGLVLYTYLERSETNYMEIHAGIRGFEKLGVTFNYTSDSGGSGQDSVYLQLSYTVPLAKRFYLDLEVGETFARGGMGYRDYKLAVGWAVGRMRFDLALWDTDLSGDSSADERLVLSLSISPWAKGP